MLLDEVSSRIPNPIRIAAKLNKLLTGFLPVIPVTARNLRALQAKFSHFTRPDSASVAVNHAAMLSLENPADWHNSVEAFSRRFCSVPAVMRYCNGRFC